MMQDLPADHPVYEGHFPGDPIVPGAFLLAMVWAEAQRWLGAASVSLQLDGIRSAKFLAPVRPGLQFAISLEHSSAERLKFRIVSDSGHEHVTGLLTLRPRERP